MFKILEVYGLDIDQRLICAFCGDPIKMKDFKDELSRREFHISGLCQKDQDMVFEKKKF